MEFPSFNHHHHHHHHRYVPPPPPPKNFSDDRPNAYPHHHHPLPPVHLRPPPQLSYPSIPPPPPQPPITVLPPPPSYNPHQSHFTFLDAQNPPFLNHTRSSPPPPRFSNQSYRFDNWNDSRSDPHRVQPELPHRNPISSNDQHRRLYSPNPQSENYCKPHGSERVIPSSRFRDDSISDGYVSRDISNIVSQEQQVNRGGHTSDRLIGRYASARSVMNMDKPTGSSSRNLEDYVEKYEPRYMTMSEGERIWDLHGEEDPRWVMKGKQNEFGHNDGVSFVSGREQLRDYGYESSKFNRAREGREEFKQVQKKSVLLRIGKPNNTYRNRNHEQHSSKAYLVESNNSNYRGKDKDKDRDRDQTAKDSSLSLEQKMDEDREHSPVELDVSFKSNGLIAKAVLTPSSPMSDNNHTQSRNRKIKRVTEFSSPLSKFSNHSTPSGSSSHGTDSPSSSEKAPKQVADKDSVSNVDNGSLSGPVLAPGRGSGRPDGPLSFRLRKKRKLMNLGSNAFNFQLGEKDDKSVKVDNSQDSPIEPISGSIASPPHEEMISSKSDESPMAVDSEKNDLEVDNPRLPYVKSFGDSSPENRNLINGGLVNDLNQQPCENENSLNLENDNQKISTDVKLSLGGTDISSTLAQDQIEILKCPTESYVSSDAAKTSHDLCNGSVNMQETSSTADMNSLDSSSDEIIIVSPENSDVQVCLGDASRKEDESQLLEGTSKQTCFIGSSELLEEGPKESIHAVIVAEDNASPSSSHKESSSDDDEVTERVNPISTSVQLPSPDHREPSTDVKADLPPPSSIISAFANGTGAFTDSNGKSGESMPDMVTSIVSSQNVSSLLDSQMLTSKSTYETISDSSVHKNDVNTCEKSVSDGVLLDAPKSFVENSKTNIKTSHSAFQCSSVKSLGPNTKLQGLKLPMKPPSSVSAGPRVFAGRSTPVFTNLRINNPTNKIAKPRTWHRSTSNPVPLPPKHIVTGQNSYIRSGNTLVRKDAPATVTAIANASAPPASRSSPVYQLNPSGPIETRNTAASGIKSNNSNSRTAGSSAPVMRPKTPPLSGSNKLPDCPTYLRDLPSSPLEHLPASPVEGNFAVQKVSEDLTSNSESQKLQYVKRKSNQLVAAPSSDQSIQDLDKTQASLSDSYYKRSKNQLIRTSVGDDSAAITDVPETSKNNIKRQSGKGISKKYHLLRFPSVWTLNNSRSSGKDGISLRQKKLRPQLFPWKRSSIPSNNLSSSISRKLLLSRKRETIYTRSRHGFSLHMSKLLSVGGSSLKWSKSLERNSKRVNKEATLAVAAAEKKKRERHDTVDIKTRNNISRDRIFRIGLVRYKMDPSRRTLQKISDEEEPSTSTQSKEETRKTYIPKRLKIGHDEYVRIGNGNQLVRNPKRRTRIFANEKVRWSLHTARSRLAKKKKYCQFFTRFGKCNKDDGKCPYIHDSSKIAVCTKFLNGSCSNPNCKLTHKVIPERMQDCSYFLQGLCSNKLCPYRHVNVKSDASICEGFLKGFCADGNECRKKHTYACPVFEATGTCSQGTKCKLHHPKNRLKRKQQDSMEQHQKNARGRYFGSFMSDGGEAIPISEKHHHSKDDDDDGNGDILCQEGKFAEYISLDFGNDEAGELTFDQRTTLISEPLGLDAADSDELLKPIRIMNKVVSGSPSDCDVGVS